MTVACFFTHEYMIESIGYTNFGTMTANIFSSMASYNPIYEDDYVRLGIRALEVASTPALVVNWGGSETVSAEDYLAYAGSLLGLEPRIRYGPEAYHPLWPDVTKMHEVLGRCEVPWRDGFKRMLETRCPERLVDR